MSLTTGQVTVSTSAGGTVLCQLPSGPASVVISNGGTAVIYLGAGTAVAATAGTATTAPLGMPVPSGQQFTFDLFAGSAGTPLRAITSAGSATAGFIISTSYGLPQPGSQ